MSPATLGVPTPDGRCESCGAPVRWAVTAANRRPIPLDPEPVEPRTRGALVLIGETAYGRRDAAARLMAMFAESEADADHRAMTDYAWHVAHFATCPKAHHHRRNR
ncbi:hypothetical protein [Jiangella gansuensis]|uniref:hypothetical protein n=1 Tax=Jiangella gansuensis TaxID=281473 RepID=UPI00047ABCF5|nr:hypothetical protein [Jiangella gansuensis]